MKDGFCCLFINSEGERFNGINANKSSLPNKMEETGMSSRRQSRKSSDASLKGESRTDHGLGFPRLRDSSSDRLKAPASRTTSLTRLGSQNSSLSRQSSVASSTNFNIKAGITTSTRPTARTDASANYIF